MTASFQMQDDALPSLAGRTFFSDVYATYHRMRLVSPVCWSDQHQSWLITSYATTVSGLQNPTLSAARPTPVSRLPAEIRARFANLDEFYSSWLMFIDPPDHGRLRQVVQPWFTPAALNAVGERAADVAEKKLALLKHRQVFDLLDDFAKPVAARVLLDFLGLQHIQGTTAEQWARQFYDFLIDRSPSNASALELQSTLADVASAFRQAISQNQHDPKASTGLIENSLTTERIAKCSEREVLYLFANILLDGLEPMANALANGSMLALVNRGVWADLVGGQSLSVGQFNEMMRLEAPFQYVARRAARDTTLGGKAVGAGQRVMFLIGAANRDPLEFPDPDTFNASRSTGRSLAFGHGIHACLGMSLSRRLCEVSMPMLAHAFPALRLINARIEWREALNLRQMKECLVAQQ
jgi:pimeloyl-[acyl-carrier protein] synthase